MVKVQKRRLKPVLDRIWATKVDTFIYTLNGGWMSEIGGYIFVAGVALMTLCSIYVTFFLPEQDARYRTGYKNNKEVNEDGGCSLLVVFMTGAGLALLGFFLFMIQ